MWFVRFALRRPVSILVAVMSLALASALAVVRMPVDIFPELGAPAIFVAQPYGGLDPRQMEAFATYYYEYHFLYVDGIEHVESKSIQSASLMKLVFHPGTDMNQAMSQTVAFVNRARALMPPGAVPPFVLRYDAGSVPVAQLVLSSPNRGPGEMQDIALNLVRPVLATIPGVSAPPPFGGNQRTIVVRLDPDQMRQYKVSPEEAVAAMRGASSISPSGNIRTGDLIRIATNNGTLGDDLLAMLDSPVRTGSGPTVYLRDIATIENSTDIIVGYAHVDGRRTVYIPITKRSDASTLDLVQSIRDALPRMDAVAPEDVEIRLEFDQSEYVRQAISSLVMEGLFGAFLTGMVVLLFLRDVRSAVIVILTIPFSLLAAVVCLWAAGQTVNIMTLGGLALSVGLLVDQSVVFIESLHTHLTQGLSPSRAVLGAARMTAGPLLMARLAILAVFLPSFFMQGVGGQLFVPLTLAVTFAMVASYLIASTVVPILSAWFVPRGKDSEGRLMEWVQDVHRRALAQLIRARVPLVGAYVIVTVGFLALALPRVGTEIFPEADAGQFQLRLRAPTGTRIERTEIVALNALEIIREEVGPENVRISTAFIGIQGSAYPVNTIYLWTGGPHEAVLKVALGPNAPYRGAELRERLRERFRENLPGVEASFEAGDIVSQVMSFGSNTDIEVAVQGFNLDTDRVYAEKVQAELAKIPSLRDLQYGQRLDYPTLHVDVDRLRAGQVGLTVQNVARSLIAATSSTRFVEANFWPDNSTGVAYQIQAEIPQEMMASAEDIENVPIHAGGGTRPILVGDVARVSEGTTPGEIHRYNMQRLVSLTANVHGQSLGEVSGEIRDAVARAGEPPRGVTVDVRGRIPPLEETIGGLQKGLLLTVAVIFLLLAANFQSFRLGVAVILIVPAVLCGVVLMLLATGTTLNMQSFMGTIMVLGVAGADSILLLAYAERFRREGKSVFDAAWEGGCARLRALLMTVSAMTAGMIPLALAFGTGAEQAAPLGRAVIGGLLAGTFATMLILPAIYAVFQAKAPAHPLSLDPDDPTSPHYEAA
ncbi:MAG: acriflavin resistance protein [Acidobacteria bacterium RIFCSPLOWO2_12_FULL_67_14]|nr:MAG: acriflavin resistance protein [Acidobacteria bacterium RIFCSPLOWO2_12_FULL_67_14]